MSRTMNDRFSLSVEFVWADHDLRFLAFPEVVLWSLALKITLLWFFLLNGLHIFSINMAQEVKVAQDWQ